VHEAEESVDTWDNAVLSGDRNEAPCVRHRSYGLEAPGSRPRSSMDHFRRHSEGRIASIDGMAQADVLILVAESDTHRMSPSCTNRAQHLSD